TTFERFCLPLTREERGKRLAGGLSAGQIAHLDRWGYPYVFDDFRFHMTLTGPLPVERRDDVPARLRRSLAPAGGDQPDAIDRIGLFKQDGADARFRVIQHAALAASP